MVLETILGLLTLFIVMIVQVIIPPVPAEAIVIGAAKLYGVFGTTLVSGMGLYAGSLLVYYFGKGIQNKFDHVFKKERVAIVVEKLKEHETFILWIRILPYNPSDFISYGAGIIHVPEKKFFTISFFTSFVRCFTLAAMGVWIRDWTTFFWVLGALSVSAVVAYIIVYRRSN